MFDKQKLGALIVTGPNNTTIITDRKKREISFIVSRRYSLSETTLSEITGLSCTSEDEETRLTLNISAKESQAKEQLKKTKKLFTTLNEENYLNSFHLDTVDSFSKQLDRFVLQVLFESSVGKKRKLDTCDNHRGANVAF